MKADIKIIKYRTQIMGVAALGVILVHSIGIVNWTPLLNKVLGFGGTGVYVFVFLSAFGLYNSLKIREGHHKAEFYKRRFARLIIPYVLIAGTWYGIYDLLIQGRPLLFFFDLSTLSFWAEHKGAWYVAMLIPVYIIFPYFYDWSEKKHRKIKVLGSLWGIMMFSFVCSLFLPDLYDHLSQVFSSIIIYLIGYYYAGRSTKSNRDGIVLSIFCLVLFTIKAGSPAKNLTFISNLTWGMLGIPITFSIAWVLYTFRCRWLDSIMGFFGKYSLEMYLWNIFLIQALKSFNVIEALKAQGDIYGYISYSIIIVGGILLSVLYGKLSAFIAKKVNA